MQLIYPLSFVAAVKAVLLPGPYGPFSVTMNVQPLTDTSRQDPFAPAKSQQNRRVLLSIFSPVDASAQECKDSTLPYMTPATADDYGSLASSVGLPNDTFHAFELQFCELLHRRSGQSKQTKLHRLPLAIFSPGYGESRLMYGVLARSLASHGYVVITVDHPYDPNVVEFPDGSIIRSANLTDDDATLEKVVKVSLEVGKCFFND